ncbi:ABC transporter permease [Mycobacterium sp. KBS0706]|uniref:ABC transporter permease n=1 Tax=Mycobacterium sp. KBS0706 TaxID=2578109 RepID=UPI00110FA58E|nr:ABC transporter permease [Mycobacterium sp. KBS0706]TSD88653.1 ABC transporter permease [Mycobacterium sp. KBS0706]
MRLEPRERASPLLMLGASAGAALLALLLCAIPLLWAGAPVLEAYGVMIQGAFGSRFAIAETLSRATPLMLTGLAATVAFRAKLWNIGAEGQLYLGALAATALGSGALDWPAWALLPLILAVGALAGGLWMLGPTLLKTRFGVDEVVTTLLLNFVVLLFVSMMLEGPMKDPLGMGWPQSAPILDAAALPKLIPRTRVHAGLVIAVVAAVLVWLMLARTTWGFEMRATGANPSAARFAGMPVGRVMLRVGLISGALAGLAGVGEVAGLKGYLTQDLSPGYGYAGIVVAMLAQLHALGVLLAALFVAAVFVGADSMSRAIGVSSYIANLVVATSLLTVLLSGIVLRYRVRWR